MLSLSDATVIGVSILIALELVVMVLRLPLVWKEYGSAFRYSLDPNHPASVLPQIFCVCHLIGTLACLMDDLWFSSICWLLTAHTSYLLYAVNRENSNTRCVSIVVVVYASMVLAMLVLCTMVTRRPDTWGAQGQHNWRICIGFLSAFTAISCAIARRQWVADKNKPKQEFKSDTCYHYHARDAYLPLLVNIPATQLFVLDQISTYIVLLYCVLYCTGTFLWFVRAWCLTARSWAVRMQTEVGPPTGLPTG
jgi:hypothetical protein